MKLIPLKWLFGESFAYVGKHLKGMALFTVVHIIFSAVGFQLINGWQDVCFLPWLGAYYLFWCFFFRFYFNRRPYLMTSKLFYTLVPSTKMLALTALVVTVLLILPLIPLFLGGGSDWTAGYDMYLQRYMEDSQVVNVITAVIFTLAAPLIFFRPMMAWINSLIGRSGSLKFAFSKTRGNYWRMVLLIVLFEIFLIVPELGGELLGVGNWLSVFFGSPVIIFLNIVLAKIYDYFFLEIDG